MKDTTLAKLKPHQVAPAEHLIKLLGTGRNVIDGSKCGAGKTYVTSAVLSELDCPTLVVAPKIAEYAWKTAADHFGIEFSFSSYELARAGYSPVGHWDNPLPRGETNANGDSIRTIYQCQSCQRKLDIGSGDRPFSEVEPCYCHPNGIHCVVAKKRRWKYGSYHWNPNIKRIVFDEAHRCGAPRSLNADMMIAAKRQGIQCIMLTATPACTPMNMRAIGYLLGLHNDKNFYSWVRRYGCGTLQGMPGFRWIVGRDAQRQMMDKLKDKIFPSNGVALDYKDIPGFPERTIEPRLCDFKDKDKIDALYAQMGAKVEEIERRGLDYVPSPLTERLTERMKIEMLKVPVMAERAQTLVEQGNSVALFVNYSETISELSKLLKTDCIVEGTSTKWEKEQRDHNVAAFMADEQRIIIVNNKAGNLSLSLHDTHGDFARYGLVSLPESAVEFIQLLGRLHRTGGMTPAFYELILAAGTVETRIKTRVEANKNNVETLTDADLNPLCQNE